MQLYKYENNYIHITRYKQLELSPHNYLHLKTTKFHGKSYK